MPIAPPPFCLPLCAPSGNQPISFPRRPRSSCDHGAGPLLALVSQMRKASHPRCLPPLSVATHQANERHVALVLVKVRAEREPGAALPHGLRRDFLATW